MAEKITKCDFCESFGDIECQKCDHHMCMIHCHGCTECEDNPLCKDCVEILEDGQELCEGCISVIQSEGESATNIWV